LKKILCMILLIIGLTFTGCSDENNTKTLDNNNTNTSENISSKQYNILGYWKVHSKELDSGYYIIEFKNNNTMVEYFPNNNIFTSTYEVKNSSENSLIILTSNGTLINLQKIDNSNMNLVYDTVKESATRISKVDFTKLLNALSESKDESIIYNSNTYYQQHNKNYTTNEKNDIRVEENYTSNEETNIKIEENYTNNEETNVNVEENYTNNEETNVNIEQDYTNNEETNINVEENYTNEEETNINIEQDYTNIEENDIDIEENNTNIEENNLSIEEDNTDIEQNNINVEEDNGNLE